MRSTARSIGIVWLGLLVLACQRDGAPPAAPATAPAAAAPNTGIDSFGEPVGKGEAIALAQVLAAPDAYKDRPLIVSGTVRATCQNRGCWMEMVPDGDSAGQGCRVTFKDYGFFVPKDSTGRRARVKGVVAVEVVDKDEVEHMESEGGRFARKFDDGSAREVRLVATGVELWR